MFQPEAKEHISAKKPELKGMKVLERNYVGLVMEGIRHGDAILVDIRRKRDFPSHLVFFSLPDPSRTWHSEGVSNDIRFLCINPLRPVINGGLLSKIFDWNVTPEGGMSGFWLSPESPEELGLTCKARKSLVPCLVVQFMAVFPEKERRLLS